MSQKLSKIAKNELLLFVSF